MGGSQRDMNYVLPALDTIILNGTCSNLLEVWNAYAFRYCATLLSNWNESTVPNELCQIRWEEDEVFLFHQGKITAFEIHIQCLKVSVSGFDYFCFCREIQCLKAGSLEKNLSNALLNLKTQDRSYLILAVFNVCPIHGSEFINECCHPGLTAAADFL